MLPADNVLQSGLWVQEHYRNTVWLQTQSSSFSFVTELFTAEWSSLGTFSPWAKQAAQTLCVEWNGRRRHTSNPTSSHRLVEETIPILWQITGTQEQNLHSPNLSSPGKGRKLDGSVSPELDSAHEPPADLGLSILCWQILCLLQLYSGINNCRHMLPENKNLIYRFLPFPALMGEQNSERVM